MFFFKSKTIFCFIVFFLFSFNSYAKTILIGDSLMGTIGPAYIKENGDDNKYYFKVGSGLINKKTYNWEVKIKEIPFEEYEKVIINIGTNDFMPISGSKVGSEKWQEKYTILQESLIKKIKIRNKDIDIIWLSPPALRDQFKNKEVAKVRDVINLNSYILDYNYMDVREVLGYNFIMTQNGKQIRTKDGIHYTNLAGKLIVDNLDI